MKTNARTGLFILLAVLVVSSPVALAQSKKTISNAKTPNEDTKKSELELGKRTEKSADEIAWSDAQSANTFASYQHYEEAQPGGAHLREAKARILILEFDSSFGKTVPFTAAQIRAYMDSLKKETYSTKVPKTLEYYLVESVGTDEAPRKEKVVVKPSPDNKACSLRLEAGNLSISAFYISTPSSPPIARALFPEKLNPTMTHTGYAGPGLEIELPYARQVEFKRFLDTFSIFNRPMGSTSGGNLGYVIPDLVWRSDEQGSPYPHYGTEFTIKHENREIIFRVDGVMGIPKTAITSYEQALALKTYLKIRSKE